MLPLTHLLSRLEVLPVAAGLVPVLYAPGGQTVDQEHGGVASLVAGQGDQGLGAVVSLDPDIDPAVPDQ